MVSAVSRAQGEIHVRLAAGGHVDRLFGAAQALELHLDQVAARYQEREAESAVLRRLGEFLAAFTDELHVDAGQRGAARFGDGAGNDTGLRSVGYDGRHRREQEQAP